MLKMNTIEAQLFPRVILGSRSPRRKELLCQIVDEQRVTVLPPSLPDEPGFDDCHDWVSIDNQLLHIARLKNDDVRRQVSQRPAFSSVVVLTADTVIVGTGDDGRLHVLGQPPQTDNWRETVREWFTQYYFGKIHTAATAICLSALNGQKSELIVKTEVAFRSDGNQWLDWYLQTDEPLGKAGGYAIQGVGSIFVEKVTGSLSNVVGLPLHETRKLFSPSIA